MAVFKAERTALHVSCVSILWNLALSLFKLLAGIFAHSGAMLSDAAHSLSDVLSTVIVIFGVKLSHRASDREHPYGHERVECVAAILLSVLLCAVGLGIGWGGIARVLGRESIPLAVPGALALAAAVVSIVVKEALYWYTRSTAKALHSGALMADAWHHRSDALSSVGSFAGILGARMGFPILDPLAGVVISLMIVGASCAIFRDAVAKMMDTACDEQTVEALRRVVTIQPGVLGIDQLKTRLFGEKVYVDVEIEADGEASLTQTHATAQLVHDAIETQFPQVKHCMVHVNPAVPPERTAGEPG